LVYDKKLAAMETKTLLTAVAVLAAGLVCSQAQSVFSANVAGYIKITVPANGYRFIGNQLVNGTDAYKTNNNIQAVLTSGFVSDPNFENNTVLNYWNGTGGYNIYYYFTDIDAQNQFSPTYGNGWYDSSGNYPGANIPVVSLNQGAGGGHFLYNPTGTSLTTTLTGTIVQGTNVYAIYQGFNTYILPEPVSTNIDSALVNFPGTSDPNFENNDVYYHYNSSGGYDILYYFTDSDAQNQFPQTYGNGWYDGGGDYGDANPALWPNVGEAFQVNHVVATPNTWTNVFIIAPFQTPSTNNLWLQVQMTNTTVSLAIHPPWNVTNGVYDLFYTTNLAPPSTWAWVLRCAPGQTNLTVTGLIDPQGFFILGLTNDADGDGLTDAYELLVSHTNPNVFNITILSQPTSQMVVEGGRVTFSVGGSGIGPFTYQWQLNGTNLPNDFIITTVAGTNGYWGYYGDGGPATNASLFSPYGVAVDASGNFFIADQQNLRIRKVDTNGIITTVAGNGNWDYSGGDGDGGAATNAGLANPEGVAVDSSGNLFIAEEGQHRIRKVDTTGTITTVAGSGCGGYFDGDGGAATNACLNYPNGVAVDAFGNLFIADKSNNRIRKVGTNGIITTVAGGGSCSGVGDGGLATNACLAGPYGVVVDASGNLFIADSSNNRIRKVDTNGIITTVAGNGYAGYFGDGGAATDASLDWPNGVAVDGSGNLFIADTDNSVIRKVDTNGIITTMAGDGYAGCFGDGGVATNASLDLPRGVAVDTSGNLFIADSGNNLIRKVTVSSLTLCNVTANNAGNYTVIITSPYGSVTSSNATLTVLVPPAITIQPTNQTVFRGTNASFSVTAAGTTPLAGCCKTG
jgi:sugar lactone lactonase YvrE